MKLNPLLLQHFREPKNVGCLVETLSVGTGIAYQDTQSVLQIQINVQHDIIIDARFQASGCYAVIAVGSWLASTLPMLSLAAAKKISSQQMIEALALPMQKNYSAALGKTALDMAIQQYEVKQEAVV